MTNEEQKSQIEFLSIMLSQAYDNTKSPKTFEEWQKGLYSQILIKIQKSCETDEEATKAKGAPAGEKAPENQTPTGSAVEVSDSK